MKNSKIPLTLWIVFSIIGFVVAGLRQDIKYFFLFETIGVLSGSIEFFVNKKPAFRQFMRLSLMFVLTGGLLGFLSLCRGVNFQFPQIFFDASAGIVTGALIQLVIARIFLPFLFGNAFCSRACWNGLVFEMINKKQKAPHNQKPRSEIIAWSYLILLIVLAFFVSTVSNPAEDEAIRKWWIIGENIWIIAIGLLLTGVWGSRAYCRLLCPFLTVSGLFSRYSIIKITPIQKDKCIQCGKCNEVCPMYLDVMAAVTKGIRMNDRSCILCERCVDECPVNCIQMAPRVPGIFRKNV
jgi:ferredoxin-type protein NapH